MAANGNWTTPEAREKAKGRSEFSAQNRMYNIMLERDKLQEQIKTLDRQNEILIEEARALLELYPGLKFREN
jgi:hypothetical protein